MVEGVATEDDPCPGDGGGETSDGGHDSVLQPSTADALQPLHDTPVPHVARVTQDGHVT